MMKNTDNMRVDDEQWRKLMRRYFTLTCLDAPSDKQRVEMAAIDEALHQCELRHVRGSIAPLVDDYIFAVGQAGDLGGTEL